MKSAKTSNKRRPTFIPGLLILTIRMNLQDLVTELRDAGVERVRVGVHDGEKLFFDHDEMAVEAVYSSESDPDEIEQATRAIASAGESIEWNGREWDFEGTIEIEEDHSDTDVDPDEVEYTRSDIVVYDREREEKLGNGYDIKSLYHVQEKIDDDEFRRTLIDPDADLDPEDDEIIDLR